jgi:putative transcriptional regulator
MEFKPKNVALPEKGKLLISDPLMGDPYFSRSVILLCEHNDEGSFGFILNKYVKIDLEDIIEDMPSMAGRISLGGPVENNNLYYIHTLGESLPGSLAVTDNLYIGGDFEVLRNMIASGDVDEAQIRFFVGYSGWGADQLMEELDQESWYVSNIEKLPIMDTGREDLWAMAFKQMGGSFAALANFPVDPGMN